jgi:hypothetical protein
MKTSNQIASFDYNQRITLFVKFSEMSGRNPKRDSKKTSGRNSPKVGILGDAGSGSRKSIMAPAKLEIRQNTNGSEATPKGKFFSQYQIYALVKTHNFQLGKYLMVHTSFWPNTDFRTLDIVSPQFESLKFFGK